MNPNALRREVIAILTVLQLPRLPAIRRSLSADWLYATDLPGYCSEEDVRRAAGCLADAGWTCKTEGGWMLIRKIAAEPPDGWVSSPFGTQAACCASMLRRQTEKEPGIGETAQYALIKAGEEGYKAYEEVCSMLHGEWAERLRQGRLLPDISLKYFEE